MQIICKQFVVATAFDFKIQIRFPVNVATRIKPNLTTEKLLSNIEELIKVPYF